MPLAKLSSKSQIVVPAEMRRSLDLHAGDLLQISLEADRIVLRKAPRSFVDDLEHCFSEVSELFEGYEEELDAGRDEWDK